MNFWRCVQITADNTKRMMPNYNDDPSSVACWIKDSGFPLRPEEADLVESVSEDCQPMSIQDRYELVVLYWQVVGWLRG